MVEVNELRQIDEDVSNVVDMPSYPLIPKILPTAKQMLELKSHIEEMKILRNDRFKQFEQLKSQILVLFEELDAAPNTTLERNLICGGTDIKLSSTNLNVLEKLLCTLQNHLEDNKIRMEKCMERINVLCDRLKIDCEDRKGYMSISVPGWSDRAVKEASANLEKLELLKLASIKQFVAEARKEISQLWEKCLYSEKQKKNFAPMYVETLNEEILTDHEEEIDRLKKYLDDNSKIFQHLAEFSKLWFKKIELDSKEKDPNRLFNRRKNNLAQEEAERKRIKKLLPKIEREMFEMVHEHDIQNENRFTIYGVPFGQYIEEKKAEHGDEADFEKIQKKDMRKKLIEHETIYGSTPIKLLTPMNVTSRIKKSASAETERHTTILKKQPTNKILTTASSGQKALHPTKKAVPGNQQGGSRPKRPRINDTSIISGNLQNTVASMDSTTSYKDQELISSTFSTETKNMHPKSALRGSHKSAQIKAFTPTRQMLKEESKTPIFKTPSSISRFGSSSQNKNKNGTFKSGRKIPFKI